MAVGREPHLVQQLGAAVGAQRLDATGELVADALELPQRQQSRAGLCGGGAAAARRLAAREARGQRARELALEPGDLVAQVAPGGALVVGDDGSDRRCGGHHGHLRRSFQAGM